MKCLVCGKDFLMITTSHLATHGCSVAEYKKQFPGAELEDSEIRAKKSNAAKRRCLSDEYKKQLAINATKGRDKVVAKNKERWMDPSFRERMTSIFSENQKKRWANDGEYIELMKKTNQAKWKDDEFRQKMSQEASSRLKTMWTDQEYRKRFTTINLSATKWHKEEIIVMEWLKDLGLYETGSSETMAIGFLPHAWLPTNGFSANGDFVDYNNKLIIQVDGEYWHKNEARFPEIASKDNRLNEWCRTNGWSILRLSDAEIKSSPESCIEKIKKLIA